MDVVEPVAGARRRLWARRAARHRWFLVVLLAGAALRLVAMLGFRPALWFPDSYTYVVTALRPSPDLVRPAGYSMFLMLLEPFHSFAVVALAQHVLGLGVGVLVYATARRFAPGWAAVAAAAPVLLDAYQIELEHLLVSDTLFMFLLTAAVCLTLRRGGGWRSAAVAGLLLAALTLTRTVGLPLIALFAAWYLVRRSPRQALALVVAVLLPVTGYAGWFGAVHHRFGLIGANGVFLYARTMAFADCAVMRPPPDLAVLCDPRPPAERPPSQDYIWAAGSPLVRLPGITFLASTDRLAGRFAALAIREQPGDYLASVAGELARSFTWTRPVYPDKYIFDLYEFPATPPPPPERGPAMAGAELARQYERGPIGTSIEEPYAAVMRAYQDVARLPGGVLLIVLLVPPAVAGARWARRRRPGAGGPWALPWTVAAALLVVPAATAEFDYRYVLPAVPLACLAAALAGCRPAGAAETSERRTATWRFPQNPRKAPLNPPSQMSVSRYAWPPNRQPTGS